MDMMMLTGVTGLGAGLGVLAARVAGPQACSWPSLTDHVMVQRLSGLFVRAPGRSRRAVGGALMAVVMAGGGLAAYAAAPSAPERLPSEVQGVVGSGDQLSLKLTEAAGGRTIKPGDVYSEGWTLKSATAWTATLTRNGEEKVVGLNPSGAVAAVAGPSPATTVSVIDPSLLLEPAMRSWNGKPEFGLTLEETQRFKLMDARISQIRQTQRVTDNSREGLAALLGADGPDYIALDTRRAAMVTARIPVVSLPDASGRYKVSYLIGESARGMATLALGETVAAGSGDQALTVSLTSGPTVKDASGQDTGVPVRPGTVLVEFTGAARVTGPAGFQVIPGNPQLGGRTPAPPGLAAPEL